MVIPPQSELRILVNIPLDAGHLNTLLFEGHEVQANYFQKQAAYIGERYTFIRKDRIIKVDVAPETIANCNYLMFRNFSTRWYYAFIDSIEYENNTTAIIRFTIDWFQTYFNEVDLMPCYVEREHVWDDRIGRNLVPEKLEYGDYIYSNDSRSQAFYDSGILIAATVDATMSSKPGGMYGNIYSGLVYHFFETAQEATTFINTVVASVGADAIVGLTMYPSYFFTNGSPKTFEVSPRKIPEYIGTYKPRNKKLFTYPYSYIYVTNCQGNSANFQYEYFEDLSNIQFVINCDVSLQPSAVLVPLNYKNAGGHLTSNVNELMSISGWPQCPWISDVFKAYIAQNGAKTAVNLIGGGIGAAGSLASGIAGAATGNPAALLSGVQGLMPVANDLASLYDKSNLPAQAHGSVAPSTMFNFGYLDFVFMDTHITPEFAQIIDGYFDMFGYAVHKLKVPELNTRPNWNYVKTINCIVRGAIPVEAREQIQACFNNGITLWHNPDTFGDYSQPNPPELS